MTERSEVIVRHSPLVWRPERSEGALTERARSS